jgi:hypothetical protein
VAISSGAVRGRTKKAPELGSWALWFCYLFERRKLFLGFGLFDREAAEEALGPVPSVPLPFAAVVRMATFAASVWHGSFLLSRPVARILDFARRWKSRHVTPSFQAFLGRLSAIPTNRRQSASDRNNALSARGG